MLTTSKTISLQLPQGAVAPKFTFGNRVVKIDDSDPEDTDVQAGLVVGVRFYIDADSNYEWSYELDPTDDELSDRLNSCGYQEEFAWVDECDLQLLDEAAIDVIYAAPRKSYEQIMAEYEASKAFLAGVCALNQHVNFED